MTIITICGSVSKTSREEWDAYAQTQTLSGNIVLTVNVWGLREWLHSKEGEKQKKLLDKVHFKKIEMSDEVHILVSNNYIGESTQNEIEHANLHNKKIIFIPSVKIEVEKHE